MAKSKSTKIYLLKQALRYVEKASMNIATAKNALKDAGYDITELQDAQDVVYTYHLNISESLVELKSVK